MEIRLSKIKIYFHVYFLIIVVYSRTIFCAISCEDGSFSCENGNSTHSDCVDLALVCDKVCDCDNCEDEKECESDNRVTTMMAPSWTFPTNPKCDFYFWCSNNKCIDTDFVCDGLNTCGDYSDERSCIGCNAGSFSCNDGNDTHSDCIDPVQVCDEVCNCDNCQDEEECYEEPPPKPPKPRCRTEFWCSNDRCLGTSWVCDNTDDCGDFSDERSCGGCKRGTFLCPNDNDITPNCINPDFVCDTVCDCDSCEDEKECFYDKPTITPTTVTPRPTKPECVEDFWCSNNMCLSYLSWVCDNFDDCKDNSDERSCTGCERGSFSCNNGNSTHSDCISPLLVCDKVCDCDNCEDEKRCFYDRHKPNCANSRSFWCSNDRCIWTQMVCDTRDDCGDNSDERSCQGCLGTFACEDGYCINPDFVCDTVCDCPTCNDEQGCYAPGVNIGVIVVPVCIVGVFIIILVCVLRCRSKKKKMARARRDINLARACDARNIDLAARQIPRRPYVNVYDNTERQLQEQYQPERDRPSNYETVNNDGPVNDGPIFSVSPSLFSGDTNDGPPAYDEVGIPMADQLQGRVNPSMTTEEDIEKEKPPPSYDTVADVFNANITSAESSSKDGDALRFRRSSSCLTDVSSHNA